MTDTKPPVLGTGGFSVAPSTGPEANASRDRRYVEIPCNMLARELAAVCCGRWTEAPGSYRCSSPFGSEAVVHGPDAAVIVRSLSALGPKALQVFAVAIELWREETSGRDAEVAVHESVGRIAGRLDGLGAGKGSPRLHSEVGKALDALGSITFTSAPRSARFGGSRPGSPLVVSEHGASSEGNPVVYCPGAPWARELTGRSPRVAVLPRSFLALHAKNERYKILISWYLAIMLRVNRKYGWHYRVTLKTLLQGAGIDIPRRNVSRFLAAIYRSLVELPGIGFSGPPLTLYSGPEILASRFDFWAEPELLLACCDRRGPHAV